MLYLFRLRLKVAMLLFKHQKKDSKKVYKKHLGEINESK
jgi:hypothetical protein